MTAKSEIQPSSIIDFIAASGGEVETIELSKEEFLQLAERFPELRMERKQNGKTIIMSPIKGFGGLREGKLVTRVTIFCEQNLGGGTFGSSAGFDLPDGTTRSPDVSWVNEKALEKLRKEESENGFLTLVPDFVIELRSKSDRLPKLRKKMSETWIANGVKLAWLIDPYKEKCYIYRADESIEVVTGFDKELDGENVLPGFKLKLEEFKIEKN